MGELSHGSHRGFLTPSRSLTSGVPSGLSDHRVRNQSEQQHGHGHGHGHTHSAFRGLRTTSERDASSERRSDRVRSDVLRFVLQTRRQKFAVAV